VQRKDIAPIKHNITGGKRRLQARAFHLSEAFFELIKPWHGAFSLFRIHIFASEPWGDGLLPFCQD
jgi:hypothetical protein